MSEPVPVNPNTSDPLVQYLTELNSKVDLCSYAEYPKDSKLAKAYEVALDIRKFEIELYWKRAGYFWLLLAALATSLGLVVTAGTEQILPMARREIIALFISCAGMVLALCWVIVNRASKGWQRNWELQVDVLEDKVIGPLHKTIMFKAGKGQYPLHFSISDANFWISFYFLMLFVGCVIYFSGIGRYEEIDPIKLIIVLFNFCFICWLLLKSRTMQDRSKFKVPVSYTRRDIVSGQRVEHG